MSEEKIETGRPRLLVIDDDVGLCELLTEFLQQEGFGVIAAYTGEHGVRLALAEHFDLVMLDVMLPGVNGFDVLRRIRGESGVPVLMLTAKGEAVDRIIGLELGADDYLPKPFNTRELLARINAILRRTRPAAGSKAAPASTRLTVGDVEIDPDARIVRRGGEAIELTGLEFDLLHLLLREVGRVVPRERLFKEVLGRRPLPEDRSLDMHVSNLRKKLGHRVGEAERIRAVRGHGYVYARASDRIDDGTARQEG